jgi:tetratricopeptide (TPR) repeat protein
MVAVLIMQRWSPVAPARRAALRPLMGEILPARQAWRKHVVMARTVGADNFDETPLEFLFAAYCEADIRWLLQGCRVWTNYLIFSRTTVRSARPNSTLALRRMAHAEQRKSWGIRLAVVGFGASVGALTANHRGLAILGVSIPHVLVGCLLGAMVGFAALRLFERTPLQPGLEIRVQHLRDRRGRTAVLAFLALGANLPVSGPTSTVILGLAAGAAAGAGEGARLLILRSAFRPPRVVVRLERRVTGWRALGRHRAAVTLAAGKRPDRALVALRGIAGDYMTSRPGFAAAVTAQIALLEADRGRWQPAVDAAERAKKLAARGSAAGVVDAAYGAVRLTVGDSETAVVHLRSALAELPDSDLSARAVSDLARALTRQNDIGKALAVLASAAGRAKHRRGVIPLLEAQVATAWASYRAGRIEEARDNTSDMIRYLDDPTAWLEADETAMRLWGRSVGQAYLLEGRIAFDCGDLDTAHKRLVTASQRLDHGVDPVLRGTALVYLAQCLAEQRRWPDLVPNIFVGIQLVETQRTQLTLDTDRGLSVAAQREVYDVALGVLTDAASSPYYRGAHHANAGRVAVAVLESLRRGALAAMLRSGRGNLGKQLGSEGRDLLDRIAADEAAGAQAPDDLEKTRAELRRHLSAGFAALYLPQELRIDQELPRTSAHILMYEFFETRSDLWRGYRIWIAPGGSAVIDRLAITDPETLGLLSSLGQARQDYYQVSLFEDTHLWSSLAADLLPASLLSTLIAQHPADFTRLVIVPGEQLAFLPWAALLLDPHDTNQVLVRHAAIQLAPNLDILVSRVTEPDNGEVLAYVDCRTVEPEHQRRRLTQSLPVTLAADRAEFVDLLDSRSFSGAYLSAHGTGVGMSQEVWFTSGGPISAAAALRHTWPSWVLFTSCFVGKVEQTAGREPFGLVVACMLGGCRSVIGGVIEVEQTATNRIALYLASALRTGTPAAQALRDGQRSFLEEYGAATTLHQWAGLICISTELPL